MIKELIVISGLMIVIWLVYCYITLIVRVNDLEKKQSRIIKILDKETICQK